MKTPEAVADRRWEVIVLWGDNPLHVSLLPSDGTFDLGVDHLRADFVVDHEIIGTDRLPLLVHEDGGQVLLVPPSASAHALGSDGSAVAVSTDALGRSSTDPQSAAIPLDGTMAFSIELNQLRILVRPVEAPVTVRTPLAIERRPLLFAFGSLAVHSVFIFLFQLMPPSGAALSLDSISPDSRLTEYFAAANATEDEEAPVWLHDNGLSSPEGGEGAREAGEEGQLGRTDAPPDGGRFGIRGPRSNQDVHMAQRDATAMAANAGILGALPNLVGSMNAPTSPYGREQALGNDPLSALGAMMGDTIASSFGYGGLGMRGTGRHAGGTTHGTIGLGRLGTIGHGTCDTGQVCDGQGYGRAAGGFTRRPEPRGPTLRALPPEIAGQLSRDVIRRVIQRHINEVRHCYEQGLMQRPDLGGRVVVSFIIAPTGSVQASTVAETTLRSAPVETCIASSVRRWPFPSPENGGVVTVRYPFLLDPVGN